MVAISLDWLTDTDWGADAARDSLLAFTERMFPAYDPAPHHVRIAEHLEAVERGDLDRLIVTMPPRHGKSTLASEHFPAWFLGRNPDKRVIGCAHTAGLAYRFSRLARNKLTSPRWPFVVAPAGDLAAVQTWDLGGRRGGYVAAGVGGPITGYGADLLLIDDPVKSAEEADSDTYRDRAWEWWTGTAVTRLEPGGAVVVIGTRWHEEDLIGRLLVSGQWTLLHLPALSDDGDALWPDRYPAAALDRIRADVGARNWEAQYQGRPSPAEGGTFKRGWWRTWTPKSLPPLDAMDKLIQSWDMTFRETKSGSFVVGQVWGTHGADCYLLDQYRARVDFPGAVAAVRALTDRWPQTREKIVEDKANGPAVVATLKHEISGLIEVSPQGGKEARANAVSHLIEAGNVYLPDATIHAWVDGFREEAAQFPNGKNDDQVDSMSQALVRLTGSGPAFAATADEMGAFFGGGF